MIADKQLEDFTAKIVKAICPQKIILFGSYTEGAPSEERDVDFLLVFDSDKPKHKRIQARRLSKSLD